MLLDEPEAMLAINAARTILNYLDSRLAKYNNMTVTKKVELAVVPLDDLPF